MKALRHKGTEGWGEAGGATEVHELMPGGLALL